MLCFINDMCTGLCRRAGVEYVEIGEGNHYGRVDERLQSSMQK